MKLINDYNLKVLSKLNAKVAALKKLQTTVFIYLPEELKPHCRIANYEAGVLKFAVASPAWATRLRYAIPDLHRSLNEGALRDLKEISFYIEVEFDQLFNNV
jgi:hypothetical protein